MPLLNLTAKTSSALLDMLREIDIKVPAITNGRTDKHRERYLMARFLATVAKEQILLYPFTVKHQDKPDFVLQLDSSSVGVECVEAVPQEWYEVQAIRERKYPSAISFGQRFEVGKRLLDKRQREDLASGNSAGIPWMGNSAEIEWAEAIAYFMLAKTKKLHSGNYASHKNMWLLMQDEWRVPVHSEEDIREAATLCLSLVQNQQLQSCFSKVFICSGKWLLSFTSNDFSMSPIVDLWRDG